MSESPSPPAARRPRRWRRRLGGALLGIPLLAAAVGGLSWWWRVELVNRFLTDSSSVWRVRVAALDWEGGRLLGRGISVSHADQKEPVFSADALSVSGDLESLKSGRLGDVVAVNPRVFWRAGLRGDADSGKPALSGPMVEWTSLNLTGGAVDVADEGAYWFRGNVAGTGGGGAWHHEGRLALEPQELAVTDAVYGMILDEGAVERFDVRASRVEVSGSVDAANGRLDLTKARLQDARLTAQGRGAGPVKPSPPPPNGGVGGATGDAAEGMTGGPAGGPAGGIAGGIADAEDDGVSVISSVVIRDFAAPGMEATGQFPWEAGLRGDLSAAAFQVGSGLPFEMAGVRLGKASAALPLGGKVAALDLSGGFAGGRPNVEKLDFSGVEIPDAAELLQMMGQPVPAGMAGHFKAEGQWRDLSWDGEKVVSTAEQALTLSGLQASAPGLGKATLDKLVLGAVPDEVRNVRRLRRLELSRPEADLEMTAVTEAVADSGNAAADSASPTAVPAGADTDPDKKTGIPNPDKPVPAGLSEAPLEVARESPGPPLLPPATAAASPPAPTQTSAPAATQTPSPTTTADAKTLTPTTTGPAAELSGSEAAASPERPLWEGWTADLLTVTEGSFKATLPQFANARVTSAFAVETTKPGAAEGTASEGGVAAEGPHYQVSLVKPTLVHPAYPDQPIALAGLIQLTASAAGLWQKREIDSLTLAGSRLQIGEALFRLVNALPSGPAASSNPPPRTSSVDPGAGSPAGSPWRLKAFVLDDTLIQLDHLGDGRRLDIPVKRQEFRDIPLDSTALARVNRPYKIEVPNITLYSPFTAGQKVAVLDTNYIQFTPAGLMERRLDRVDLMMPSLYAGQPLFDFVDAARQRFTAMAAVPAPAPQPLLVDSAPRSPTVLSALASVTPADVAQVGAEWEIPFYTESGKVFVAPKGFPWPNLPVIPFRNARDAKGKPVPFLLHGESFHGELSIEPGWYDFPEYKVRLRLSDRGRIVFNTPQKDRDNNLTEVFERNTLIFRQLQIDEAWLSITYDARGIYAKFGGLTCGGTLSGGVNLYLDELYTWDGWVSMVGVGMEPLTKKLTPDTFRMSGPIDELTVKAYGDTTTLYQATLDLRVTKPGFLHVLALDAMKDRIDALGGLSADLGQISLATLRDFPYTGCSGQLKLFGTEGAGSLVLTGPTGSRTINLKLHDYRAKIPKTAAPF